MTKEQKLALIQKIRSQVESKYKKMMVVAIVVALVVGIVLGMASCMTGIVDPNMFAEPTPVPTAVPTPEPTPEPEYYLGDKEMPVQDGDVYTFDAQVSANGTPRYVAGSDDTYMTANVSIAAARLMTPLYFEDKYGKQYKLTGDEAGVQVDIKLNSVNGTEVAFCPQDALVITLESEDGVVDGGFQLIDSEISGNYGVTVAAGEAMTYYKRFTWNDANEMKYLVVTYYNEGEAHKIYFELSEDIVITDTMKSDEEIAADEAAAAAAGISTESETSAVAPEMTANPDFVTLGEGERNKEVHVKTVQKRLIELGYLSGKADGDYGNMTKEAVNAAKAVVGMEQNGKCEPLFLTILFSDEMPKKGETTAAAAAETEETVDEPVVEGDTAEEPIEDIAEEPVEEIAEDEIVDETAEASEGE